MEMEEVAVVISSSDGEDSEVSLAEGEVKDEAAVAFKKQMLDILKGAKAQCGQFATSKELENPPLVVVDVENVGPVTFPLYEQQAQNIISKFKQCPFGKRDQTVIDTSVRNSKQLDPHEFKILNAGWQKYLEKEIVKVIATDLNIKTPFKASLYKLLLYEPGSFFKPHRDTEKEKGMFGTLVVQLPSRYAGGELVVQHENHTKRFNFSSIVSPKPDREFKMFFTAFYCDCQHEVLPVTEGYRACLVYNLVSTATRSMPLTPSFAGLDTRLTHMIQNWVEGTPPKIVYVLSHKYTKSALSVSNLKGEDHSVASLLQQVSENCPLKLFLALFTKNISGGADGSKYNYELIDPETSYDLSQIRSFNGTIDLGSISITFCNEVIPSTCFKGMDPDEEQYQEHSGNEGATADKWYRGAAIVFWPEAHTPYVLDEGKASHSLVTELYLQSYDEVTPQNNHSEQILKWLNSIVKRQRTPALSAEHITKVLSSVKSVGTVEMLKMFLENLNLENLADFTLMLEECDKYGWETLGPSVLKMMGKYSGRFGIDRLLLLLPEDDVTNPDKTEVLVQCLEKILEQKEKPSLPFNSWYKDPRKTNPTEDKEFYCKVFIAAQKLTFDMTENARNKPLLIGQVLLQLSDLPGFSAYPVWTNCAVQCIKSLNGIVSKTLVSDDWTRKETWSCSCPDCKQLKLFLNSNKIQESFKISKPRRYHLHQQMNHMNDLTHETMRVGSPQTLVVTKTIGAYEKKKAEQTQATALLPKLMKALDDQSGNYEQPAKVIKLE